MQFFSFLELNRMHQLKTFPSKIKLIDDSLKKFNENISKRKSSEVFIRREKSAEARPFKTATLNLMDRSSASSSDGGESMDVINVPIVGELPTFTLSTDSDLSNDDIKNTKFNYLLKPDIMVGEIPKVIVSDRKFLSIGERVKQTLESVKGPETNEVQVMQGISESSTPPITRKFQMKKLKFRTLNEIKNSSSYQSRNDSREHQFQKGPNELYVEQQQPVQKDLASPGTPIDKEDNGEMMNIGNENVLGGDDMIAESSMKRNLVHSNPLFSIHNSHMKPVNGFNRMQNNPHHKFTNNLNGNREYASFPKISDYSQSALLKSRNMKRAIDTISNLNNIISSPPHLILPQTPQTMVGQPRVSNRIDRIANETSGEKAERLNRALQKLMQLVGIFAQVDSYLANKARSTIKKMARIYEDDDTEYEKKSRF